jgi:cell division septation protein DedD
MRKATAEQQPTGSDVGQRAGYGVRAKNSDDSRRPSMSGKRTSSRGWEVRLGALQVVVWLGLAIGSVFGSYFIGFFSGRYVGFETARAASGVDVAKLSVTEELPERTSQSMSGIYDQLSSNATVGKEVKPAAPKMGSADAKVAKTIDEIKSGVSAESVVTARANVGNEKSKVADVDPFLDVDYADAPSTKGGLVAPSSEESVVAPSVQGSLLAPAVEDAGKGGEVRLLGQQAVAKEVVPDAPEVEESLKEPAKAVKVVEAPQTDTKKLTADAKSGSAPKALKGATQVTKKVPPGYFVQVAAPKTLKEAEVVAKRLKGSGFPVMIEDFSTGKSPYFRVLVGPEDNKVQAERLVGQVKRESYISGKPFIRQSK